MSQSAQLHIKQKQTQTESGSSKKYGVFTYYEVIIKVVHSVRTSHNITI